MPAPPIDLELSGQAEADLAEAYAYIARDNRSAAEALLDAIEKAFTSLRHSPEAGWILPADPKERRCLTAPVFRGYRIIYDYDPGRSRVRILRVLHSARDWSSLIHC